MLVSRAGGGATAVNIGRKRPRANPILTIAMRRYRVARVRPTVAS